MRWELWSSFSHSKSVGGPWLLGPVDDEEEDYDGEEYDEDNEE
jgi:hypothetical protein